MLTKSIPVDLTAMTRRIRHCVECPKCRTRYLIGASPYANGAYLVMSPVDMESHTLYCPCGKSAFTSRSSETRTYVVSNPAYDRGYGSPDEIFPTGNDPSGRGYPGAGPGGVPC